MITVFKFFETIFTNNKNCNAKFPSKGRIVLNNQYSNFHSPCGDFHLIGETRAEKINEPWWRSNNPCVDMATVQTEIINICSGCVPIFIKD